MTTLTIELDNELEERIRLLSQEEGRDRMVVISEILRRGLSETQRRQQVKKALEEVFALPVSGPFAGMTEEEIMEAVNREISAHRKEGCKNRFAFS